MKTESVKILLFIFCVLIVGTSFSQEIGSPLVTNYSPKQYGFSPQNWSIVKDNRGVLYFGNTKGILEFDGASWRKIYVENNCSVRSLAIDDNGIIYVGAAGSFGFLAPDSLGNMQYNSISSKCDTSIIKVFPDIWRVSVLNDEIYFNALDAIYKYSPFKQGEKISIIYPTERFFLSYAIDDKFFIQDVTKGLAILQGDTLKTILEADKLRGNIVFAMIPDVNDNNPKEVLIALNNRLLKYNPSADTSKGEKMFFHFATEADEFFKKNTIYDVVKLPGKRLAISSLAKGIIIIDYQGEIVEFINTQNNLQDETVWDMSYFDNSLWLALNNGISQVEVDSPFRFWDKNNNLKGIIQAIIRYNKILYIASTEGVFYLDTVFDISMTDIPVFNQLGKNFYESWCFLKYFEEDYSDTLLLIGQSGNLIELDKNNKSKQIFNGTIFCLSQSNINTDIIYGGGGKSLVVLKRNHKKNGWDFKTIDGFDGEIRSIVELDNELWLTTFFNGVFRLIRKSPGDFFDVKEDEFDITHFDAEQGFKGVKDIMAYKIDGEVIFASPNGIFKYDREKNCFLPYDKFGKIFGEGGHSAYRFIENKNGDIWQDETGVLYKQNNGTYLFDTIFSKAMPFSQLSGIYPENNVWYAGGSDGLLRYDKQKDYKYDEVFNTIIRKVTIKNDSVVFYGTNFTENISGENISSLVQPNKLKPVIDYEYNNLEFEYSSPYFIAPISTLYSYKLEGFDEDWSYWTDGTKKEYTNLPENEYVFRVKAKNIYGFESKIATYQFCILPPWYRVWWVYTLYVIFAMIFIWQIVRISVKRHVKAKRLLEEIVKERTAEIIKQKEEIETVAKELEIANMAKDKLFSVIAHDLKSPFNVIIGYTEILDDGYDDFDDDEIKQFISEIGKSSKSVYALLENLLLWALAQRDKIEIEKQNTNLKQLVVDATSTYLINAQNKEITFTNSVSDNISVSVDIQIIKTVIGNLFSNAIKFTPDKGAITIEATVVDDFVQVKVSDNGVGIPSEVLSKIFRFDEKHSTLGTNKEKGTGFGLSLCKEFVEKNGGEIWVESEQNVGSQFYFTVSLSISNTN